MSLVLRARRPLPGRSLILFILVFALTFISTLAAAPTVARAVQTANHAAVCHCAQCPGIDKCCCGTKPGPCPAP